MSQYTPKQGFFGSVKSVGVETAQTIVTTARVANTTVTNTGAVLENTTGFLADSSVALRQIGNFALEDMMAEVLHERALRDAHMAKELEETEQTLSKNKVGRPKKDATKA